MSSFVLLLRHSSELIFDLGMIPKEVTVIQESSLKGQYIDNEKIIAEKLLETDVYLIDCSFFSSQFEGNDNEGADIYLETDEFHTPKFLVNHFEAYFKYKGLTTNIRASNSMTNIPNEYYQTSKDLKYLMIQVNPEIYLNKSNSKIDSEKWNELNKIIQDFFIEF